MKVQEKTWVNIEYVLKLDSGEEIDRSEPNHPLGFVWGEGQVFPALEKGIEGLEAGAGASFVVEQEDGYGPYRDELKREVPRKNFPPGMDLKPGMIFQGFGPNGPTAIKVMSVADEKVLADFNHPLAGERLHFDVKVVEVRKPTEKELEALSHSCSPSCCSSCGSSGECDSEN